MPYASKAQMRYFFAAEKEGKLPEGTARRWAHETKERGTDLKTLPDHKKKSKKQMKKSASVFFDLSKIASIAKLAASGVNTATRLPLPKKIAGGHSVNKLQVGRTPIVGTPRQLSESVLEQLKGPKMGAPMRSGKVTTTSVDA